MGWIDFCNFYFEGKVFYFVDGDDWVCECGVIILYLIDCFFEVGFGFLFGDFWCG